MNYKIVFAFTIVINCTFATNTFSRQSIQNQQTTACKDEYAVSFNALNGKPPQVLYIKKGKLVGQPPKAVRKGFTFAGWLCTAKNELYNFKTPVDTSLNLVAKWTVKDICGNAYEVINIGSQIWMAEDLRTTKLNDGTKVPYITSDSVWAELTTPACCWHSNKPQPPYGMLYKWATVNTGKLAPKGWHVPTDADWVTLVSFVGGDSAGYKLKAPDSLKWLPNDSCAHNEFKFSALPGGFRYSDGRFMGLGYGSNWWSSTFADSGRAFCRGLCSTRKVFDEGKKGNVVYGFSVRCIKD